MRTPTFDELCALEGDLNLPPDDLSHDDLIERMDPIFEAMHDDEYDSWEDLYYPNLEESYG